MLIRVDDLRGAEIAALLQEHIDEMNRVSPRESKHALDLEGLRAPDISVWTIWDGATLAGCAAMRELSPQHGELKSMRTAFSHRRKGVGKVLLDHVVKEAQRRGYSRLSLETGSMPHFEPARRLYASYGFSPCPPFAEYNPDPNSVFMTRLLTGL